MTFFDRSAALKRLASDHFDVLVIGGGITGVGVALDAVSRGLKTALIERDDFASGTSSKSSKLIHGGLRYLQQGEVRLVYEALHERQRLRRNASHLVQVLPFMIPILTKDGVVSKKIARALGSALWMYDLTGGWRIGKIHRRLKQQQALAHMPTMPSAKLSSAYVYYDATADDARVCLAIARTAAQHGAVIVNRCGAKTLLHDNDGKAIGARVTPINGAEFDVRADVVINAAGVWADEIRQSDTGIDPESIRPAKGIHITVPWKLVRNDIAVVIPVRSDKRSLFVVPWVPNGDGTFQYTYIGTTDTDYSGSVNESQCSSDDITYVLDALNASITTTVTREDITAVWSGLRPLVRSSEGSTLKSKTQDLSRKHKVEHSPSGMISITGGKLTTYRRMAQDTVNAALAQLGRRARCRTKRLSVIGSHEFSAKDLSAAESHLVHRFGSETAAINEIVAARPDLAEPLINGLPYLKAEAIFAVRNEMATTLDDVLSRRTRALLINRRATLSQARGVAELIAPDLGWSVQEIDKQVASFVDLCAREEAAGAVTEAEFLASNA